MFKAEDWLLMKWLLLHDRKDIETWTSAPPRCWDDFSLWINIFCLIYFIAWVEISVYSIYPWLSSLLFFSLYFYLPDFGLHECACFPSLCKPRYSSQQYIWKLTYLELSLLWLFLTNSVLFSTYFWCSNCSSTYSTEDLLN